MKAGWEVKPLGELIELVSGQHVNASDYNDAHRGIGYLTGPSDFGAVYPTISKWTEHPKRLAKLGDILLTVKGSGVGSINLLNVDEVVISRQIMAVRPQSVLPRYLYLLMGSLQSYFFEKANGAAIPGISRDDVLDFPTPIPPLEEQKRIVAVLDAAFEGLTRAKENAETNLQNARELFERRLARAFSKVENSKHTFAKTVADIALPQKGSIRTGPFGSQLLHSEFTDEGIAVLGIDNAVKNEFRWGKSRFISPDKYESLSRYTVKPGDVIITIMGTCGRCAVVPDDIPVAINTKHLCCITLDPEQCIPDYLHAYFLHSEASLTYLNANASGSVMDGLNMGLIKELPVHLPSLFEQRSIADLYQSSKATMVALEANYQAKLTDIADLRQSLLQKAFAGELT